MSKLSLRIDLLIVCMCSFVLVFIYSEDSYKCSKKDDECSMMNNLYRLTPQQEIGQGEMLTVNNENYKLITVNANPPIFEIENFLTKEECEHFIQVAKNKGLKESNTQKFVRPGEEPNIILRDINKDQSLDLNEMMITLEDSFDVYLSEEDIKLMYKELNLDQNNDDLISRSEIERFQPHYLAEYVKTFVKNRPEKRSRHSSQIWLFAGTDEDEDKVFTAVQNRVQYVTNLPHALISKSDFQVVRYGVLGHYNAHHDSSPRDVRKKCCTRKDRQNCRICRYMTVLFYLSDVEEGGETAFPAAGNTTFDMQKYMFQHQQNLMRHCDSANLKVYPQQGKALLWYNHFIDSETGWLGDLDLLTSHGGCPVFKGQKWIANFWILVTDDKNESLL